MTVCEFNELVVSLVCGKGDIGVWFGTLIMHRMSGLDLA